MHRDLADAVCGGCTSRRAFIRPRRSAVLRRTLRASPRCCADKKCVALGEIGLDYHWDTPPRAAQQALFRAPARARRAVGLPVQIHSRDCCADMLALLREHRALLSRGFLMHCYSHGAANLPAFSELGAYFSFGGVACFKNAANVWESVRACPADRMLTETDSPYLSPFRGEKNTPANIPVIAARLAQLRGEDEGAFAAQVAKTRIRSFPIGKYGKRSGRRYGYLRLSGSETPVCQPHQPLFQPLHVLRAQRQGDVRGYALWLKDGEPSAAQVEQALGSVRLRRGRVLRLRRADLSAGRHAGSVRLRASCTARRRGSTPTDTAASSTGATSRPSSSASWTASTFRSTRPTPNCTKSCAVRSIPTWRSTPCSSLRKSCRENGLNCWFSVVDCVGEAEVEACRKVAERVGHPAARASHDRLKCERAGLLRLPLFFCGEGRSLTVQYLPCRAGDFGRKDMEEIRTDSCNARFFFKKKFGQNFLTDGNLLDAIVRDAGVDGDHRSGDRRGRGGAHAGALRGGGEGARLRDRRFPAPRARRNACGL